MKAVVDQLPQLGKRVLICLLLFTCNYVVSARGGFLFLWVLGMVYDILLWHSLSLPYNYFEYCHTLYLRSHHYQADRTTCLPCQHVLTVYVLYAASNICNVMMPQRKLKNEC